MYAEQDVTPDSI